MADRYDVAVKVVSQIGTCDNEHAVGEEWIVKQKTPEGICLSAFKALLPDLRALMYGGRLPWTDDPDVARVTCPDDKNPVVYELRRLRE